MHFDLFLYISFYMFLAKKLTSLTMLLFCLSPFGFQIYPSSCSLKNGAKGSLRSQLCKYVFSLDMYLCIFICFTIIHTYIYIVENVMQVKWSSWREWFQIVRGLENVY